MMSLKIRILFLILGLGSSGVTGQEKIEQLGRLNVHTDWISLSGFSSGGTFAQQLQFSYSSIFSGIAVFSHTYYRCGPGTGVQEEYDNYCTTLGNFTKAMYWDPQKSLADIRNYFARGLIEDPRNLKDKRLYVYAGTENFLFTADQSLRILNIYEPFIQNPCSIRTRVQEAGLSLPTESFGGPCRNDSSKNFFLANCGLSGPFEALNFLLGGAAVSKPPSAIGSVPLQPLRYFDQTEFTMGLDKVNMDTVGFIYIPSGCLFAKCLIHFYFHGCLAGREFLGEDHIRNSGYLEIGEMNSIIMVFPQGKSSLPQNEIGCWDTYGISGELYATQKGVQVTAVRRMLARILGEDQLQKRHLPSSTMNLYRIGNTPRNNYLLFPLGKK